MNTPLTEEQLQLLSAYADGEVTQAERQAAELLLQRADAREYLDSLQATITLVKTHAPVRAPVGLSGRVMNALEDEFKPKAIGPGSEPFTGTPVISWRTPLYAIAAAVVVSLGIMFGPSLVGPREGSPESVARTVLDDLPAPDARSRESGGRAVTEDSGPPSADPANELSEEARKQGGEWSGARDDMDENLRALEDAKTGTVLEMPEPNADKKAKDTRSAEGAPAPSEAKGTARGNGATDDKNALNDAEDAVESDAGPGRELGEDDRKELGTKSDHEKYDGRAGARALGGSAGGGAGGKAAPKPERRNQDGGDTGAEENETEAQRVKRARAGGESAPAAPAQPADGAAEAGEAATLIQISDAGTLTAQTDVLWVSSLYGDASLADEDSDVESVTVEIDADKLPELMAALRKLAADQGYGEVAGAGEDEKLAERKAESEPRISGYLPADKAAEQPQDEAMLRAPARVRMVIRLK